MLTLYSRSLAGGLAIAVSLVLLAACVGDNYREQGETMPGSGKSRDQKPLYKDLELPLNASTSAWKGNSKLKTRAAVESMQLNFDLTIPPLSKASVPVSGKDTFPETLLKIEVRYNGKPVVFDIPDTERSWLKRSDLRKTPDSTLCFETELSSLYGFKDFRLSLPLFVFAGIKAGTPGTVSIRVWQDYFVTEEKAKQNKTESGQVYNTYYRDTLRTKLIDNVYSCSLTIPQIFRTDIICDSIILQNDKNWSPGGSDNTIFKSSYPDIYFSLSDLYYHIQSYSATEKSTARYTIGDTLAFYHYSVSEPFQITVYDYDVLSRDDVLGDWTGELGQLKNNTTYPLRFGHIRPFYLRKKEYGQLNK